MIKVYRYDNYYHTIKQVEVYEDTPINQWLGPMFGDGGYIYTETLEECKTVMKEDIAEQIQRLQETMKVLEETLDNI